MELKKLYNLPHVNVLEYYRTKLLTKAFLDKLKPDLNHYREMGPFLPTHLKIFFKIEKCATDIYKVMNNSSIPVMVLSGKAGSCLPLVGSLQYRTLTYVLVSSALPTTRHDMTCTVLKAT